MWFVADRINIRIFLRSMIYSTVSARFIAQLNMSFMQYLLFWNCRYIGWYWKPSIDRLWHNKWRCGWRFDPLSPGTFLTCISFSSIKGLYPRMSARHEAENQLHNQTCSTQSNNGPKRCSGRGWLLRHVFFSSLNILALYNILMIMTCNLMMFLSFSSVHAGSTLRPIAVLLLVYAWK